MARDGIKPPNTRAQCDEVRPCLRIACRYHLCTDHRRWRSLPLSKLPESCALDVADRGPHTLKQVGRLLGVTRERIRQIESAAKRKLGRDYAVVLLGLE
jgi:hypothetical protein